MDRFTAAIAAGVLVLVAVAIVVAFAVRTAETTPDLATPAGVTLAYAQALRDGDPDRAWDLLAQSVQDRSPRDEFVARASGARGMYADSRLATEAEQMNGDTARVDLVRTRVNSGGPFNLGGGTYSDRNTVRLAREAGAWRITTPPEPFLLTGRD